MSLVIYPGGPAPAEPGDVLRQMGFSDGRVMGAQLLRDSLARKDPIDVEMALIVTAVFGVSREHLDPLIALAPADWHKRHEDIATALGEIASPTSVDALQHLATWVPDYLDFDDSRALAAKAVRSLSRIPGATSEEAITALLASDSELVRKQASRALDRRRST